MRQSRPASSSCFERTPDGRRATQTRNPKRRPDPEPAPRRAPPKDCRPSRAGPEEVIDVSGPSLDRRPVQAARSSIDRNDSIPFVCTVPRTYSETPCLAVSWSNGRLSRAVVASSSLQTVASDAVCSTTSP